jgi:hypothetical protein
MILVKKVAFLALIFIVTGPAFSQKIKYKDLFVLLNAKQYDQAEPFLKKYLKENQDNPNAFLFMGNIFEEKALANDVLRETEKHGTNSDSAVLFLNKAFQTIDAREIKKNDEYYQSYGRRDLRTGEFGIKLSDIQFDLEKRTKALTDRKQRVQAVKDKFIETQRIYGHSEDLFKAIASRYKDSREFYLRSNGSLTTDLTRLGSKYDSCLVSFNDYKTALQGLGKTGHKQQLDSREIVDFKKDGYSPVDFLQDEVKVWDYKRWALSSLETIEKEVVPLRETLLKLDAELNTISKKLKQDSVSVLSEISTVKSKIEKTGLHKFDPNPMPEDVFKLKISELEYGSELAQTKALRDSSSLVLKQSLYKRQITLLSRMDSLAGLVQQRDFEYETENYKSFVTDAYGSPTVLKGLAKALSNFAVTEKADKEKRVQHLEQLIPWIIDQNDSIPAIASVQSKKFNPLTIVPENYTFGLAYRDSSAFAYFYAIQPSRKVSIKAMQRLDSSFFKKQNVSLIKSIAAGDDVQKIYFITMYSESKKDNKTPTQIYLVNGTSGLAWSNFYLLEGIPTEATYNKETGNLLMELKEVSC